MRRQQRSRRRRRRRRLMPLHLHLYCFDQFLLLHYYHFFFHFFCLFFFFCSRCVLLFTIIIARAPARPGQGQGLLPAPPPLCLPTRCLSILHNFCRSSRPVDALLFSIWRKLEMHFSPLLFQLLLAINKFSDSTRSWCVIAFGRSFKCEFTYC